MPKNAYDYELMVFAVIFIPIRAPMDIIKINLFIKFANNFYS